MGLAAIAFHAEYAGLPDAHAQARIGRTVIPECLCVSVQRQRANSDYGPGADISATLRYLASGETAAATAELGGTIDVMLASETTWTKYRVAGRRRTGEVVSLGLEDISQ
jgi:hypothetical protein